MNVKVVGETAELPSPSHVRSAIGTTGADDVTAKRSTVDGEPAIEFEASSTLSRDDGTQTHAYSHGYELVAHGRLVMVMFFRHQPSDPEFDAMTTTMIKSVKVLK